MARVSVLIPTYRGGAYLREAVQSVLAQTFTDFELVIVSDGCPDPLDDLEQLDPRIRLLRQQNRGESVARNVGMRACGTDLVAFLDDDDRMLPRRLELQLAAMEAAPEAGLCHSQFRFIDAEGKVINEGYSADVQYLDLLRSYVTILMPTTMMRRSRVEEVGTFDSMLRTGQDLEVIFRVARVHRLAFVPEVLVEYRLHATNASADSYRAGNDLRRILRTHLMAAELARDPERVAAATLGLKRSRSYVAKGAIKHARTAWRQRDLQAFAQHLGQAARLSPAETARDLVGNRRPLRALRSQLGRSPEGTPAQGGSDRAGATR